MKFKSIGHDSEFFIFNNKGIVDPLIITDGTKKEPETKWGDNVTWQADGMALEIGSVSPFTSKRSFSTSIHEAYIKTHRELDKQNMALSEDITTTIPEELLQGSAAALGCSPDYNAYTASQNPRPSPKVLGNVRCVGRHVHIGVVEEDGKRLTSENMLALVKALDITLGSGCVGRDYAPHAFRTQFYGMAGSFRPKPYGVEYRVPSFNFLNGSGEWIFDAVTDAIDLVNSGELEEMIALKGGEENLIQLVNSGRAVLSAKQRSGRGMRVSEAIMPNRARTGRNPTQFIVDGGPNTTWDTATPEMVANWFSTQPEPEPNLPRPVNVQEVEARISARQRATLESLRMSNEQIDEFQRFISTNINPSR